MKLSDFDPFNQSRYTELLHYRPDSTHWETVSRWFIVLIMTVFPMLTGTDGYYNITESKYFYFNILVWGYIGVCLFILLGYGLDKKLGQRRWDGGIQKLSLSQIVLIIYFAAACVSSITSPYASQTLIGITRFEGLISIFLYVLVFVFLSFWGEYHDEFVWFISIMLFVFSTLSVMQVCGLDLYSPKGESFADVHFICSIGNIDMIAGFMCIMVPIAVCTYIFMDSPLRWVSLAAAVLAVFVQLFTDVDSGKIGFIAAFAVITPFVVTTRKNFARSLMILAANALAFGLWKVVLPMGTHVEFTASKTGFVCIAGAIVLAAASILLERAKFEFKLSEKTICLIVAAVIIACAVVALIYVYNYEGDFLLLHEFSEVLHGRMEDSFGNLRGFEWKSSLEEALKRPYFGGGPGVFVELFTKNDIATETIMGGVIVDFAHNDFLQIAVCQGFIGLGLYIVFILTMAVRAMRIALKNKLAVIFMASAVAYLAHSFFSFSIAIITPMFWVAAGILDKIIRQTREKEKEDAEKAEKEQIKENRKKEKLANS